MYECPAGGQCGFGSDTPHTCKHGLWVRTSAAPPSGGRTPVRVPRALALKLLGRPDQPATETVQGQRFRAACAAQQRNADVRADAARRALEKELRAKRLGPIGGRPTLVDPASGKVISAHEWWARGLHN